MEQPGTNALPSLEGLRVLIVEDDLLLLMELESILREAGAEVVGRCSTVADAMDATKTADIAAAVLDVRLGHETSAPVARQLARCGTPFLFYTGQVGSDPALAEWPGSKIVAKPATPRALVSAVAELVR